MKISQISNEKYELIISALGNAFSWYNFALFMPFLPIFSKEFFPIEDKAICSVVSFLALSIGLFFRPLGASIFGPIGDKFGRNKAISLAIWAMVIPTICIGFLPNYQQIGIWAPILLICMRALQGISLGGEYAAAMVHLVEIAPNNRRGFFGSWTDVGSQVGVMLAGQSLLLLYTFFSEGEIYKFAWRYAFFSAAILIPFAFLVPDKELKKKDQPKRAIIDMLLECKKEVACTVAITSFSAVCFYTLLTFLPYYLVRENILSLREAATCSVISNVSVIIAALSCGRLSDTFTRKPFLRGGMVGVSAVIYFIFLVGVHSYMGWILTHIIYGLFLGMYFASRSAFFSEAFPKHVRCTGVSVSLSFAQAIVGGTISVIMNYCTLGSNSDGGGCPLAVIPITIVTMLAAFALTKMPDRTGEDLM